MQQIGRTATAFEQERTGHRPTSATDVASDDNLVSTTCGALSPAEQAMAQTPQGAAQLKEYHRQLFEKSSDQLRNEIGRITGVQVRDATARVEPSSGSVVEVLPSGTVVQVFLLSDRVATDVWSDSKTLGPT